jgi:CheY-like chemotaxis protein
MDALWTDSDVTERDATNCAGGYVKTVLVIDDEASVRELMGDVLDGPDCRILEADGADKGVELAIKEHPDVVLADFLMPGMNGLDLLHRLRSSPVTWDIPVILMSGFGADETLLKLLVTQDMAYLMKPFTASELLMKLQEVLGATHTRKRLPQGAREGALTAAANHY